MAVRALGLEILMDPVFLNLKHKDAVIRDLHFTFKLQKNISKKNIIHEITWKATSPGSSVLVKLSCPRMTRMSLSTMPLNHEIKHFTFFKYRTRSSELL